MLNQFRKALLLAVAAGTLCTAAHGEDNNCDDQPPTSHGFQTQPGDTLDPTHLHLVRSYAGTGKVEVNICNADVKVVNRADTKTLEVLVNLEGSGGGHPAADFVKTFRIDPNEGVLSFQFGKAARARVTLFLPIKHGSEFEFNLGHGDLSFYASRSAGERQINVGMGTVKLFVSDTSYADMQVNVGMGAMHDHRPGGKNAHFVVNRDFQASGDGSLQINVGMGTLDIERD